MAEQFQNFFVTKLREACDAVATTIYVETVPSITEGTLVLEYANSTKHEILHFTGVSGYGLTGCTRGLEGTTAQSHSAGVDCRQNLTAGMIDKIINGVITTENIANSAVTTAKINNGAVTADKIDFTTLKKFQTFLVANLYNEFTATIPGTLMVIGVGSSTWGYGGNEMTFKITKDSGNATLVSNPSITVRGGDTVGRTVVCAAKLTFTANQSAKLTLSKVSGANAQNLNVGFMFGIFIPSQYT